MLGIKRRSLRFGNALQRAQGHGTGWAEKSLLLLADEKTWFPARSSVVSCSLALRQTEGDFSQAPIQFTLHVCVPYLVMLPRKWVVKGSSMVLAPAFSQVATVFSSFRHASSILAMSAFYFEHVCSTWSGPAASRCVVTLSEPDACCSRDVRLRPGEHDLLGGCRQSRAKTVRGPTVVMEVLVKASAACQWYRYRAWRCGGTVFHCLTGLRTSENCWSRATTMQCFRSAFSDEFDVWHVRITAAA